MTRIPMPGIRPADARFSSGPTKKRPGWTLQALERCFAGALAPLQTGKIQAQRGHRPARAPLLGVPADFKIAIVPASDTGAVEMALWSMLGARPVDVFAWESFGEEWVTDAAEQLQLEDCRIHVRPSLRRAAGSVAGAPKCGHRFHPEWHDLRRENPQFRLDSRGPRGTSRSTMRPARRSRSRSTWSKCDVVTFSWQKVLGGEAAHGMLILSPRAVARLESYVPPRPLPKIFRMTKKGRLDQELFEGATINTPSLLATEDYLDALKWAESIGGRRRIASARQCQCEASWPTGWRRTPWVDFLAPVEATRSNTSVCLKVVDERVTSLPAAGQAEFAKNLAGILEKEGVALDAASYRSAPPGLRIWCGATVEQSDLQALTPWLDWAFASCVAQLQNAG